MFPCFPSFFNDFSLFSRFLRRKKCIRKRSTRCYRRFFLPKMWLNESFLAFYFLPWYSNCVRLGILNCSKQRRITFFCNFLQKNEKCYSFFFELSFFLASGESISCQSIFILSQSTSKTQFLSELKWNNTNIFLRTRRNFWISTDNLARSSAEKILFSASPQKKNESVLIKRTLTRICWSGRGFESSDSS